MAQVKYVSKIYSLLQKKDGNIIRAIMEYLEPDPQDKILEMGCGRGFLTREIQKIVPDAVGIDVNAKAIASGVAKNLKAMDVTDMDFPSNYFDKIYSCHTIEHIEEIGKFFRETERVLKPGGKILLVYPYELIRGAGAIFASLVMFGDVSYCRKIHVHKLNPRKIRKMILGTKLKHKKSRFFLFNSPQYLTILEKY